VEREVIPACKGMDIGVTAWSPLPAVFYGESNLAISSYPGRMSSEMMNSFCPIKAGRRVCRGVMRSLN